MNDKLKTAMESVKSFWEKFSTKTKIIFFSVLGAVVVGAIVLTVILNAPKFVVLYPSLDSTEAKEVVAEIEERGLTYKESDGTIYVLEADEASLRMDLANLGHPYSTYNYEFFLNNVDAMTTDAERQIIEKFQLSQKLETVISTIDSIERASVTINLAETDNYVISNNSDAKSSVGVLLTITKGKELTPTQVSGIKTLISKSVPNLSADDVSIVDAATSKELNSTEGIEIDKSQLKLTLQRDYESNIVSKIKTLLSTILEPGNYEVAATSNIDVDEGIQEIITYTPSEDNRGVISHEEHEYAAEGGDLTVGGVPGTDSNVGTTTYSSVITTDEDTVYVDSADTYDYLVSQMTEQIQKQSAKLVSLNVSVVVKDKTIDAEQKNEIAALVANAAGIADENVVVYNGAYIGERDDESEEANANTELNPLTNRFIIILSIVGGVLLIALIILFLVLRSSRKKRKKIEEELLAQSEVDILEDPSLEEFKIPEINTHDTHAELLRDQIQDFTGENPQIAAQLVRTWLRGEDQDE